MEIWMPLIYPLIAGLIALYFFKHKVVWWELTIPIVVAVIFIATFRFFVLKSETNDTEYWGGTVERVEYFQEWNEYIHQTCTRECCCDSKGQNCSTETYDCSYVQWHSAYSQITDNNGIVETVSKQEFDRLAIKFQQQPKFVEMNRNFYTNDGDKYEFYWQGERNTYEPMFTEFTYENRVQAAHSVYNYPDVSEEDVKTFGLFEYPEINTRKMPSLLGDGGSQHKLAQENLTWINATLGKPKQLHVFVLMFKNKIPSAGLMQERYWKGGNDNEFVLCIGTDSSYNVDWCHTFSWSESQEPKITIRDFVMKQDKLDLILITDFMGKELGEKFKRKDFEDFNYLTVEPPSWAIIWCHIITFVTTLLMTIWAIKNDIDHEGYSYNHHSDQYWKRNY